MFGLNMKVNAKFTRNGSYFSKVCVLVTMGGWDFGANDSQHKHNKLPETKHQK
jgi:hypothetical protein